MVINNSDKHTRTYKNIQDLICHIYYSDHNKLLYNNPYKFNIVAIVCATLDFIS